MRLTITGNSTIAESKREKDTELLLKLISIFPKLGIDHGYTYNISVDKRAEVLLRFETKSFEEFIAEVKKKVFL